MIPGLARATAAAAAATAPPAGGRGRHGLGPDQASPSLRLPSRSPLSAGYEFELVTGLKTALQSDLCQAARQPGLIKGQSLRLPPQLLFNGRWLEMEGLSAQPKNLVKDSRERVRNRVGAHVEDELAKSTITLGMSTSDRENKQLEDFGTFLDIQVLTRAFKLSGIT